MNNMRKVTGTAALLICGNVWLVGGLVDLNLAGTNWVLLLLVGFLFLLIGVFMS